MRRVHGHFRAEGDDLSGAAVSNETRDAMQSLADVDEIDAASKDVDPPSFRQSIANERESAPSKEATG